MKTPRQVLLDHHRAIEPSLDSLCQQLVARELSLHPGSRSWLRMALESAWTELFWSLRFTWVGFAALWACILALNLLISERPPILRADAFMAWSAALATLEQPAPTLPSLQLPNRTPPRVRPDGASQDSLRPLRPLNGHV